MNATETIALVGFGQKDDLGLLAGLTPKCPRHQNLVSKKF